MSWRVLALLTTSTAVHAAAQVFDTQSQEQADELRQGVENPEPSFALTLKYKRHDTCSAGAKVESWLWRTPNGAILKYETRRELPGSVVRHAAYYDAKSRLRVVKTFEQERRGLAVWLSYADSAGRFFYQTASPAWASDVACEQLNFLKRPDLDLQRSKLRDQRAR